MTESANTAEAPKMPTPANIKVAKAILDEVPGFKRRMVTRKGEALSRTTKWWIGFAHTVIHASLIILYLVMVMVWKMQSISSMTWDACEEHPTLIAAGILGTVGICYLVRHWWWMCMFSGIMGGHLFVHA